MGSSLGRRRSRFIWKCNVCETAHSIECSNSLLRSENHGQQVVGIGLDNIMAIAMPDAVLVAHKNHSQEVKTAVEMLKSKNVKQAETFPKDHRPWDGSSGNRTAISG